MAEVVTLPDNGAQLAQYMIHAALGNDSDAARGVLRDYLLDRYDPRADLLAIVPEVMRTTTVLCAPRTSCDHRTTVQLPTHFAVRDFPVQRVSQRPSYWRPRLRPRVSIVSQLVAIAWLRSAPLCTMRSSIGNLSVSWDDVTGPALLPGTPLTYRQSLTVLLAVLELRACRLLTQRESSHVLNRLSVWQARWSDGLLRYADWPVGFYDAVSHVAAVARSRTWQTARTAVEHVGYPSCASCRYAICNQLLGLVARADWLAIDEAVLTRFRRHLTRLPTCPATQARRRRR